MKTNWVYRFIKFLRKVYFRNDKRVAAYLVCVVIATGFWFLNALNKTYTINMLVPVSYTNFPNNKTLASAPPEKFNMTVKAHGFTILRRKISFLFMPMEFNVKELTGNRMTEGLKTSYAFPSDQFLPGLSNQLSNDLEILSIDPDTLFFRFDKLGQKRVKVQPVVHLGLKKQYQISGDIKTEPDTITVNGPQSALDTMQLVRTETLHFDGVDESIQTSAKIGAAKELYFEPRSVKMNIPVEEYTEAFQSVPVTVNGKPDHINIKLFPAKAKVSFWVGLSRFSEIQPGDFKLTVSYADIQAGKQRLKITAEYTPGYLYELKITPEEIEYLIEN